MIPWGVNEVSANQKLSFSGILLEDMTHSPSPHGSSQPLNCSLTLPMSMTLRWFVSCL